ncbi:MAG: DUF4145 domain-containing protein [Methanobacteriota archaeon]|nr:MAG: DUF4145 domain-containing protein [Euryarchaeota archaeon]
MARRKEFQMICHSCKRKTNHVLVKRHEDRQPIIEDNETGGDEEGQEYRGEHVFVYEIVKCMGCDSFSFVKKEIDRWPPDYKDDLRAEVVYPAWKESFLEEAEWSGAVPSRIKDIYSQTIKAYNYELEVLCAAGIRAIIEGCCLDRNIKGTLEGKIDELYRKKLIGESTKEALHKLRYMGNVALHKLSEISQEDLRLGLDIVETFLKTLYVIPEQQKRLKSS